MSDQPSNVEPTPRPWRVGYGGQDGDEFAVITSPHSKHAICNLDPRGYRQANARLIVRAVNAHDDLVAALERVRQYSSDTLSGRSRAAADEEWYREGYSHMISIADAALAKAENTHE